MQFFSPESDIPDIRFFYLYGIIAAHCACLFHMLPAGLVARLWLSWQSERRSVAEQGDEYRVN